MGVRQITFSVDDRVFAKLTQLARERGYATGTYTKMLFEAAYASHVGVQDNPEIDTQIGAAIVLHGAKENSADIAKAVRLTESSVIKIIDAWRQERLSKGSSVS
jgi:hypothetical protein